jgi:16S rRNA processing protein RimM
MSGGSDTHLILGRISSVFGIKGWVKVVSHTQPRENIFSYPHWLVKRSGQWQECQVETGKPHGKTLVAKIKNVDTREEAETWVGAEIAITRDMLPETDKDEYYWADLIGLKVTNLEGEDFGVVKRLMETGSNDVLIVYNKESKTEHLIPWLIDQVIKQVDQDDQHIVVDWELDF